MSYVIAVTGSLGQPKSLVGPFATEEEATAYIAKWDEFFGDLENDIATEEIQESAPDAGMAVETVVLFVNSPSDMFGEVSS